MKEDIELIGGSCIKKRKLSVKHGKTLENGGKKLKEGEVQKSTPRGGYLWSRPRNDSGVNG